ncbi:hypothetical protein CPB84DRAFT_1852580 [Gymnopilus junonius]|uniref:Uncharacterized protein n=1 Tax=Gymnopilus junonius TaxID=109634 RepID=A0A9P5NA60_GYMJU|nr:hypothetical protein CPB84DRAFT_1852580 [Gymnopilus junonius]
MPHKGDKPPGMSSFHVELGAIADGPDDEVKVLDSLPLGSIDFIHLGLNKELKFKNSGHPSWIHEPGWYPRNRLGDCYAMMAKHILSNYGPYPVKEFWRAQLLIWWPGITTAWKNDFYNKQYWEASQTQGAPIDYQGYYQIQLTNVVDVSSDSDAASGKEAALPFEGTQSILEELVLLNQWFLMNPYLKFSDVLPPRMELEPSETDTDEPSYITQKSQSVTAKKILLTTYNPVEKLLSQIISPNSAMLTLTSLFCLLIMGKMKT